VRVHTTTLAAQHIHMARITGPSLQTTSCRHQGSASLPHSSFHYPSRKWGTSHKINCWATPNILREEKQVAPAIPREGEPRGSVQHTGQPCMGPRHWISTAWKQDKVYLVCKHEGEPVHAPNAQGAKHHQAKGQGAKCHCTTKQVPFQKSLVTVCAHRRMGMAAPCASNKNGRGNKLQIQVTVEGT
jgi:hypothetical protein